ncbi:hypothetical protein PSPO01_15705 [Paraphaeosphaeria sporulosa]
MRRASIKLTASAVLVLGLWPQARPQVIDPSQSLYCVATALHPKPRLIWFKTRCKNHPKRHQKAERSPREVFKRYLDDEEPPEVPELDLPATRKVPRAYASDERRLRTMYMDNHLLTGKRSYKRQKLTTQLEKYLDSLLEHEVTSGASIDNPHRW